MSGRRRHRCRFRNDTHVVSSTRFVLELGFYIFDDIGVIESPVLPRNLDICLVAQFIEISLQLPLADSHVLCHLGLSYKGRIVLPCIRKQYRIGEACADGKPRVAQHHVRQCRKPRPQHFVFDDDALHALFDQVSDALHVGSFDRTVARSSVRSDVGSCERSTGQS